MSNDKPGFVSGAWEASKGFQWDAHLQSQGFFPKTGEILLDEVFRATRLVGNAAMIPVSGIQSLGSAAKGGIDMVKDVLDCGIDILTLHPVSAVKDVGHLAVDTLHTVENTADIAIHPIEHALGAIKNII